MNDDFSPLVEALQAKQKGKGFDPEAFLEYILANFDLVPKDDSDNSESDDIPNVQTQESHAP